MKRGEGFSRVVEINRGPIKRVRSKKRAVRELPVEPLTTQKCDFGEKPPAMGGIPRNGTHRARRKESQSRWEGENLTIRPKKLSTASARRGGGYTDFN